MEISQIFAGNNRRKSAVRRKHRLANQPGETGLVSPLLDVVMNGLGAILLLLFIYAYFTRGAGPPVIILSEEEPVYRFDSGSAEISLSFRAAFVGRVLPQVERLMQIYDCDVIEVVGHTDSQALQARSSNLDSYLLSAYNKGDISGLAPGSNVDLGLMRAVSVIGMLRDLKSRGKLSRVRFFLPYSAGQCIPPDYHFVQESGGEREADPARRRIEIRLLRSSSWPVSRGQAPPSRSLPDHSSASKPGE
jgi:hypothetical protein